MPDLTRPEGAEPSTTTPLTRETVSGQNPPAPDGDSCACGTPLIVCECGDGRCPKCDPGDKCPESNKARQRRTAGPNALLKLREFAASPGKGGGMTVNREAARWLVKRLRDVDPSVAPVRSRAVGASDACNAPRVGNERDTGATYLSGLDHAWKSEDGVVVIWHEPEHNQIVVDGWTFNRDAASLSPDEALSAAKALTAFAELARLAEALPASSVVPVEAGTGTDSGQERSAPDGEAPA